MVIQSYESEADNEYVIRGNSVVMKCEIPSYVADFVFVDLWLDSEGRNYYPNNAAETGTWPGFFAVALSGSSIAIQKPIPVPSLQLLFHQVRSDFLQLSTSSTRHGSSMSLCCVATPPP